MPGSSRKQRTLNPRVEWSSHSGPTTNTKNGRNLASMRVSTFFFVAEPSDRAVGAGGLFVKGGPVLFASPLDWTQLRKLVLGLAHPAVDRLRLVAAQQSG